MPRRKRLRGESPGLPPSLPVRKFSRRDPDLKESDRITIRTMGIQCDKSIKQFRNVDWTTYARISGNFVKHNFGLGPEPAVKCFGCHRLTPTVLITGDHIVPKFNKLALRRSIAYKTDGLEEGIYERVVRMALSSLLSDRDYKSIQLIQEYDKSLEKDNRNIQPLCWYCNTVKGNRENVKLFPQNVLMPKSPHEAPF